MRQEIAFCSAADGTKIAYASAGSGPPLVKAANWLNHLEYDWESPIWRHWIDELAKDHLLVRYDERGNGLSDWEVADISFEAFVRDLEAVVDAVGLERFVLLGISQGCAVSVAYAARHPERVSQLILYGGYARGGALRGEVEREQGEAMIKLMENGWGRENPAFRQVWTTRFIPEGTLEQVRWYNDLQRVTASAANAVRIRKACDVIDVSGLLPQVEAQTLVLHCRGDDAVPFEQGRELAASIPGARFVPLEGRNHLMLEEEPAWQRFLEEVRSFLGTDAEPRGEDEAAPGTKRRGWAKAAELFEAALDRGAQSDALGETVSHYRIFERLGGGGMGVVYKAQDTKLSRLVALKFLPPHLSHNPRALDRFQREARAAAALSHPHICTIYDIDEHEGQPFIAMELLEGSTLEDRLQGGPLPVERVLELGAQIADALAAAHTSGVLHRDIKPGNLFVTAGGHAKVLDFGLAKHLQPESGEGDISSEAPTREEAALTESGAVLGTIAYMSPEQALGKELDSRTDVFSLGVVLYEMLTGQRAFSGTTNAAIFDAILHLLPAATASLNAEVPAELEQIVGKAMEKDRGLRHQSAADLAADLRRVARVTTEQVVGPAVRAGRLGKRWRIALSAAVLAIAVGWLAVWWAPDAPALAEGDVILLTDFVNSTGERVFDTTLEQALAVKLEESPFLDVLPEERTRETLKLMNRSSAETVNVALGREICRRLNLKALMGGEIAPLGGHYVISLSAMECGTGDSLAREQVEADSKEEVLAALDRAASNMRRRLGESLASIERYDTPVWTATTPSLEALQAYSVGRKLWASGAPTESTIQQFERAIELDPDFALAHLSLGTVYSNHGLWRQQVEHQTRAFELRQQVSERERLTITSGYYHRVTGDLDKAIAAYEASKAAYPREAAPRVNLSSLYAQTGQIEKGLAEAQESRRLAPGHPVPLLNLGWTLLSTGRAEEAKERWQESVEGGTDVGFARLSLLQLALFEEDETAIASYIEWARGQPMELWFFDARADAAAQRGELDRFRELSARAQQLAGQRDLAGNAALLAAKGAIVEALIGTPERAREQAGSAVISGAESRRPAAIPLALAWAGALEQATTMADELADRYPSDTLLNRLELPTVRAVVALQQGEARRALQWLEETVPYELGSRLWFPAFAPVYARGLAHLRAGEATEATRAFDTILRHLGIDPVSPYRPLALLGKARAHLLAGEADLARTEYESLFGLWKDANPGISLLEQARAEHAELTAGW